MESSNQRVVELELCRFLLLGVLPLLLAEDCFVPHCVSQIRALGWLHPYPCREVSQLLVGQ
eukprot:15926850-Heterocapsa_arctica.AAC.1